MSHEKILTYKGKQRTTSEWISILGLNIQAKIVNQRIVRRWPVKEALTTPTRSKKAIQKIRKDDIENGIESYHYAMRRYFCTGFRKIQYKNLNKDYKSLNLMNVAA